MEPRNPSRQKASRRSPSPRPTPTGPHTSKRLAPAPSASTEPRNPSHQKALRRSPSPRPAALRLLLAAAILTAAGAWGVTAARYLKDWSRNALATAQSFYFASQELNGGTQRLMATGGGVVDFSFTLHNYLVEGHPTESGIDYTCQVTDSAGKTVTGVRWLNSDNTEIGGGSGSGSAAGGVFTGSFAANDGGGAGEQERTLICRIPQSAFGAGEDQVLTLRAQATAPYAADLEVRIGLSTGGVQMVVTDPGVNSGAVSVALYNTEAEERTVELKWPGTDLELVPDPTWELTLDQSGTGTVKVPGRGVASAVFLKKDTTKSYQDRFSFTVRS